MTRAPNILWFMADELRASALACYGRAAAPVWTPNIDAIAARGLLFERNYCNAPVCVPSRLSMLTARPPEDTGVYANEGAWPSYPLPAKLPTFPEHFAAHGYRVASIGKSHHSPDYQPWAEDLHEGAGMHEFGLDDPDAGLDPITPRGIPSPVGGRFPSDRPYPPEAVTRNALDWLAAAASEEEPFLLRVSYLQPHTPVLPPDHFRKLFRAADWPGHDWPRGEMSAFENAFADIVGGRELSQEDMQQAQADYHALVAWLDAQVGHVMAMLRTRRLEDDTMIVFNSDHGASLGENGLLGKAVFAPQSQETPFILSWPGRLPEGERRSDISENLDLAATLCALAGIPRHASFRGRSVRDDPAPAMIFATAGSGAPGARASVAANIGAWRNGGGWPRRACVRTRRYRLDMNVRQDGKPIEPAEEDVFLADSLADPRELKNLADDPAHARARETLRAALLAHAARALEPAFIPAFSAAEIGEFAPPKIAGR